MIHTGKILIGNSSLSPKTLESLLAEMLTKDRRQLVWPHENLFKS